MARQLMELAVHPARLQRRIRECKLTGNELARRCEVGKATISRLVSGTHHVVAQRTAQAIEKELQVAAGEFFAVLEASRVPLKCKGCGTACAVCAQEAA